MNAADARHLFLRRAILIANKCDLVRAVLPASKREQVGESLDAVYELSLQVGALSNKSRSGFAADELGEDRQDQAQDQEKADKDQGKQRVEGGEEDGNAEPND